MITFIMFVVRPLGRSDHVANKNIFARPKKKLLRQFIIGHRVGQFTSSLARDQNAITIYCIRTLTANIINPRMPVIITNEV